MAVSRHLDTALPVSVPHGEFDAETQRRRAANGPQPKQEAQLALSSMLGPTEEHDDATTRRDVLRDERE
jgi:hypothetical protein